MTAGDRHSAMAGILTLAETSDGKPLQQDFRDAMASLAATACLVTAGSGPDRLGRTVTAAFSLSVDPPALLVSIAAGSALASRIRETGGFSFAMLSETQHDICDAFAGKEVAARRFDHGSWREWPSGQPRLSGAVAVMDCVVLGEMEVAGHILFAGGPREIDLGEGLQPLVWHSRRYHAVCPL
uniref:flavin reductase family protein n=1 Tax=Stappia sp. TaxID=1870903 RepID=UPI003BAC1D7C